MNKKLIAMAVAGTFGSIGASAAFAQSSTVTLSGSLNYNYGYFDNGGAGFSTTTGLPANPRVRTDGLSSQESELVLAGEENVGGGMSVFFRCATSMDQVGGTGTATAICGRTSYIGLKSNLGSISVGNNDTPSKRMLANFDPFPIAAAMGQGAQMWNGSANGTTNGTTPASFSRRQANLITYDMPTMNGFDAAFAFSAANEATGADSASTIQKPRMWSAMAAYTNGPLQLGVTYERHVDYNPAAAVNYVGGNDAMYSLAAGYTFMGSLKVSGVYNSINYNNITASQDMSVRTWGLYADWAVSGPHRVRLGYGVQGSTKGTYNNVNAAGVFAVIGGGTGRQVGSLTANGGAGQTGSQKLHMEYAYALSKRTELGLAYAKVNNDRFSNMTIGTGSLNPNLGETQTFMGMLIRHKF